MGAANATCANADTLFLPKEQDGLPDPLRAVLLFIALAWTFTGIALIADVFMGAVERITSVKTRIKVKSTGRMTTVNVWNETVANLTLMALGSSAPEILLSVLELFGNSFMSGKLGPSTIVGSAAFNLFCISAVCVFCIPKGELRKIKDTGVYAVTSIFSLFAYIWLVVILLWITPNRVDIAEAVVTFLFFPLLVLFAYAADRGFLSTQTRTVGTHIVNVSDLTAEELAEKTAEIRRRHGNGLSDEVVLRLLKEDSKPPLSRADYRRSATRGLLRSNTTKCRQPPIKAIKEDTGKASVSSNSTVAWPSGTTVIDFPCPRYAVLENCGTVGVKIERSGDVFCSVKVRYATRDGTALSVEDYEAITGEFTFASNETEKIIEIKIVDDDIFEDVEEFYLDLLSVELLEGNSNAVLGKQAVATITIIDDDEPGVLAWDNDFSVAEETIDGQAHDVVYEVTRRNGSSGTVTCEYRTENATAVAPLDYEAAKGLLTFEHNQLSASVRIKIQSRGRYEHSEEFRIILSNPTGGATFDAQTDGGAEVCIKTVRIVAHESAKASVDSIRRLLHINWDKNTIGMADWRDQFVGAWFVNGSHEEQQSANCLDWTIHLITLPWKLIFALVPPTEFCNGWVCFFVSLVAIGGITAFVSDLAVLFGCTVGVDDMITSFTFVALGTSLPDLFASKSAAIGADSADASIGNITGSNSVNVFLGLGLPWMIGAIYWSTVGRNEKWIERYLPGSQDTNFLEGLGLTAGGTDAVFVVEAKSLAFSVAIFVGCAIACMGVLAIRRKVFGGELGGPQTWKYLTAAFFVGLWLVYVVASILYIILNQ